jgi:hemin uptake protein HemP
MKSRFELDRSKCTLNPPLPDLTFKSIKYWSSISSARTHIANLCDISRFLTPPVHTRLDPRLLVYVIQPTLRYPPTRDEDPFKPRRPGLLGRRNGLNPRDIGHATANYPLRFSQIQDRPAISACRITKSDTRWRNSDGRLITHQNLSDRRRYRDDGALLVNHDNWAYRLSATRNGRLIATEPTPRPPRPCLPLPPLPTDIHAHRQY